MRERKRWQALVDAGRAVCCRCGQRIAPGAPFDLDHHDHDRSRYIGVAHPSCNRSAGARKGNARRRRPPGNSNVTRLRW